MSSRFGLPRCHVVKKWLANVGDTRDTGLILGRKDPLEEEISTNSSNLALKIPWTEEPGCSPWSHKESGTTEWLATHTYTHFKVHLCFSMCQKFLLFLQLNNFLFYVLPHLFIFSSVSGPLDYFHLLAVVNNTAMNIGKQIISSRLCLHLFFVYTQKWNCWIMQWSYV